MSPGIRATVEFTTSGLCPLVELSKTTEATVDSVTANVCPTGDTDSVTEFSTDAVVEPDREAGITSVFSNGSTSRYRLTHTDSVNCPCECLGQFECPIVRYLARDGTLTLVFYAMDYEQLREAVSDLRERFPGVDVKRLVRSPVEERSADHVLVDRGKLTTRQLEVVETAYEMGYYERPRRANATEIAEALDINPSTFSDHLAAAETKILGDFL